MSFLKQRLIYLRQHQFVKNVLLLQSGSFLGNFVQALAGVFLARLLQPEKYGIYIIAFSLASLVFISTGIQESVLVVLGETYTKKDKEGTKNALAFFLKFTLIFIAVTLVVLLFLPWIANYFYHDSRIGFYAGIIILGSCISSIMFSMSGLILQAVGRIKDLALLNLGDQIIRVAIALGLVMTGFGVLGAVSGHFIGAIIMLLISLLVWNLVQRHDRVFPSIYEIIRSIKQVSFRKYFRFSIVNALDKNIAGLYAILPVLFVGLYLPTSDVTFFKLAFGYLGLALSLLSPISVLLNFEFPKTKIEDPRRLAGIFAKISLYSMVLSTGLTILAIIVAPIVFKIMYGINFLPSIKYVSGLVIYGALFGIGVGLGSMWRAINKVKVSILINVIVLAGGIPSGLFMVKHWGVWGAVAMVTIWYTVSHFASFIYLTKTLRSISTESNQVVRR